MDKLFEAYSFSVLQGAADILVALKEEGITNEEFINFVQRKHVAYGQFSLMPKCPECSTSLQLIRGEDETNSQWLCPKCRYSQYNSKSISEVQKELLEESRNGN